MDRRIRVIVASLMVVAAAACASLPALRPADSPSATGPAPASTSTAIVWFPATGTATSEPRATVQPTADKKPGIGEILLRDDFSSPSDWNTAVADQASVAITEGGLTIAAQPGIAPIASFRQGQVFSDMYLEVTARPSLCRGSDAYGLVFRAPNNVAYYRFAVACDGTASANRINLGSPRVLQPPTPSADVPVGAPGEVRLGVWALHDEFRFFLNGRYQFTATDVSYPSGGIGVFAHAAGDTPVTVTFSTLTVYSLEGAPAVPSATP